MKKHAFTTILAAQALASAAAARTGWSPRT